MVSVSTPVASYEEDNAPIAQSADADASAVVADMISQAIAAEAEQEAAEREHAIVVPAEKPRPQVPTATRSSVEDWVSNYRHMPVRSTPGLMYFNRIPANFTLFVELMMPVAFMNEEHRDRIISEVEAGSVMTTSLDMFCRSNLDSEGNLHWDDGSVRDFVTWVFHQHNIGAPTEDLIRPLFEIFDLERSEKLSVWESICLVDALIRATFFKEFVMPDAPEGEEEEEGQWRESGHS
jgi:hypothetical protein